MKKIKLNKLRIQNFKGIKEFTLDANGSNVEIFGDNATGKTTIMDSFLWLLFNKDSMGKSNFDVIPQDSNGNNIHRLDTVVEAELDINGAITMIKKQLSEKWVKKRDAIEQTLEGTNTSYWIDEVPTKAREYSSKINDIIDEELFQMITDPLFFNNKLHWEERRKILVDISGGVTDEEITSKDDILMLQNID